MTLPPLLIVLLTLLVATANGNYLDPPGPHDYLHVVVTWSDGGSKYDSDQGGAPRNISNLVSLRHGARVIIYAKGFNCSALQQFYPEVDKIATCHSVPNFGGREAHTMLHHVAHNYRGLAHFTMFLHDDDIPADSRGGLHKKSWIDLVNRWIDEKWRHKATLSEPHTRNGCVCDVVHENFFAPGKYPHWPATQHLLRTFFNSSHDSTDIVWPASARFMVARSKILKHSHESYKRVLDSGILTNLDHMANDGRNCGVPLEEVADLVEISNDFGTPCPHSLGWAHTLERSWFMIWS